MIEKKKEKPPGLSGFKDLCARPSIIGPCCPVFHPCPNDYPAPISRVPDTAHEGLHRTPDRGVLVNTLDLPESAATGSIKPFKILTHKTNSVA
jgi:hypothetical protein